MAIFDADTYPLCPNCGEIMTPDYDNVGYNKYNGPEKWLIAGWKCSQCGHYESVNFMETK